MFDVSQCRVLKATSDTWKFKDWHKSFLSNIPYFKIIFWSQYHDIGFLKTNFDVARNKDFRLGFCSTSIQYGSFYDDEGLVWSSYPTSPLNCKKMY